MDQPNHTAQPGAAPRLPAAFVYDAALAEAELRPDHPLKPARARTCYELLAAHGVFDGTRAVLRRPHPATAADILRVHAPEYVQLVRRLSDPTTVPRVSEWEAGEFGFSSRGDNPPFRGMYEYYLL